MTEPDAFRAGMRRLAASVCIIATRTADGRQLGLTATAICSVSADPPTLLVCINRSSATHDAIRDAGIFSVNVLAREDRSLADRFAGRIDPNEKFALGRWGERESGPPLLESALAGFSCRVAHAVDVGTHGIFFGAVTGVALRQGGEPLLYAGGSFGGFAAHDPKFDEGLLWIPAWDSMPPA